MGDDRAAAAARRAAPQGRPPADLKAASINCCHSGDIRHRQGPCAEYVDLDVAQCLAGGVRYATVQVFNYNGRPMHTVKDCVFGLTGREHAQANEIFVPKTISDCMTLANEGTSVVVCVIDLERRDYVWADVEGGPFAGHAGERGRPHGGSLAGAGAGIEDVGV